MALLAVIDVETTGLYYSGYDRLVEFAAVVVDESGSTVRELETVIQPERDVGPTSIHGLTASDLENAPLFKDVIGDVFAFLDGVVGIAGHNIKFDQRFLEAECHRAGIAFPNVKTLCTMSLAGHQMRLLDCCERFGVAFEGTQHRALNDARATAALLSKLSRLDVEMPFGIWESQPVIWPTCKRGNRCLSRQQVASARSELPNYLARLMERTESFPSESCTVEGMAEYDNLLRRGIIDRNIDQNEGDALTAMAVQWRLGNAQIDQIHRHCMRTLVRAALGDGIVTKSERRDLSSVAHLLGLSDQDVALLEAEEAAACGKASKNPGVHEELAADLEDLRGRIVCFTGESNCSIDGTLISHEVAKTLAESMGVVVIENVTKKLDYLIVSDPLSQSGKAKKARQRGVPLMHEMAFWTALGVKVE